MQDAGGEPAPEPSEGLREVLEEFANTLTENILGSRAEAGGSGLAPPWDRLAGDLASAAVELALMEVCGGGGGGFRRSGPDEGLNAQIGMDPAHKRQIPEDSQACPLSQLGLPAVGSLDYPDAPPTTPLFHQLESSRSSFARKLKGGLAKVFLPSPPPPTPMDGQQDGVGAHLDPQVELMEHLVHSLTAWAPYEERPPGGAKMEALAEALSWDIIDQVLRPGRDPITL